MPEADSAVVHRLMCRHCLRTVEVVGPVYSTWISRIADEHLFTDVSRQLEIFGTCRACAVAG